MLTFLFIKADLTGEYNKANVGFLLDFGIHLWSLRLVIFNTHRLNITWHEAQRAKLFYFYVKMYQ